MPGISQRGPYKRRMTVARHGRTFPARRDALQQVDAFLGEVCAAAGLGRETCLRLTLLVEELFTNTVVHGHGADSEAPVRLECEASPGRVALTYEDTGPAHDPFARVIAPDAEARLEGRLLGGLGGLLVRAIAPPVEARPARARTPP